MRHFLSLPDTELSENCLGSLVHEQVAGMKTRRGHWSLVWMDSAWCFACKLRRRGGATEPIERGHVIDERGQQPLGGNAPIRGANSSVAGNVTMSAVGAAGTAHRGAVTHGGTGGDDSLATAR
jgi:hypothetical protein